MAEMLPRREGGDKTRCNAVGSMLSSAPTSLFGGGISVNVRLCGSIPRRDMVEANNGRGGALCHLRPVSQESLNGLVFATANGPPPTLTKTGEEEEGRIGAVLTANNKNVARPSDATLPRGPALPFTDMRAILAESRVVDLTNLGLDRSGSVGSSLAGIVVEPPAWAVPASGGEARLEPACDSVGRQASVDLTTRACFRIGRSPNCDVQLMHATSSRRHALLFHHENGSCYVVDCGSAHGTFVNGVRIPSPAMSASSSSCDGESTGMVVPHKVKRGALIRFGGPGAPCFLLKSFSFSLSELHRMRSSVSSSPGDSDSDRGVLVRHNTRINALGRTAAAHVRESLFLTIDSALSVSRKRSFDSLDSRDTVDTVLPMVRLGQLEQSEGCNKRLRCSSPPPSPEEPPLRLVSPDLPTAVLRCVRSSCHSSKRVSFSAEPPTLVYPASVTPDEPCIETNATTNQGSSAS